MLSGTEDMAALTGAQKERHERGSGVRQTWLGTSVLPWTPCVAWRRGQPLCLTKPVSPFKSGGKNASPEEL